MTYDEFQGLTYLQVKGTGLANTCSVVETGGSGSAIKAGDYNLEKFCMEPTSFTVKEESSFKAGESEFVKTKLMTRLTYTLDGMTGSFKVGSDGSVAIQEKDGLDYAAVTVQLPGGERVPFLFTMKEFTGKGNTAKPEGLQDIIDAGAVGMKLHEDWGTTPAAIDNCLSVAEANDVAVTIHTDTLNESCCVEKSVEAFKGRTIHTYHSEGAGGGHAPDIIKICGEKEVLPSSTNPTRPYTKNTVDEHLDMLMVCHHLDKSIAEDVAFAESRIRAETIAAEDILHDMGAISIMSSDSQAMGRVGEVITRTWQTAAKMKSQRGMIKPDGTCDNFRVKRYIAKYTINPAVAHGISHVVGSIECGKLADLCLWKPAFFGSKPEIVIKGGQIAWAQMGDPNASIPTPEPVIMRPMWAAHRPGTTCVAFVSKSCVEKGIAQSYGLAKRIVAVEKCRGLTKLDMRHNDALPVITVDPETYQVTADGEKLECDPATSLPLTQNYQLF